MIKQYTTVLIDMYGVILNESKGRLLAYSKDNFDETQYKTVENMIWNDRLFDKAGLGQISSDEFLKMLGFDDTEYHMKRYLEDYLTLDRGFIKFAETVKDKYDIVLLSNDVSEWSKYITEYHGLNKYFKDKIVSADVKCRKPDLKIFDLTLEHIKKSPAECIFIDNNVQNLLSAEEVGISPILFNRDNEHFEGLTVYSFEELIDYLA